MAKQSGGTWRGGAERRDRLAECLKKAFPVAESGSFADLQRAIDSEAPKPRR